MGIDGNMSGDGLQKGGLLVVERGGKVLYSFVQESFADHASNQDILKVRFTHVKINFQFTFKTPPLFSIIGIEFKARRVDRGFSKTKRCCPRMQ